jgi:hypothetical protein
MKPLFLVPVLALSLYAHPSIAAGFDCGEATGGEATGVVATAAPVVDYKKFEVPEQYTSLIEQKGYVPESPVVSDDESKIVWIGNNISSRLPPADMFIKDLTSSAPATVVHKSLRQSLNVFVKGSFTPSGTLIACELEYRPGAITRSVIEYARTGEWEPKGYHSVISFYENGVKVKALDASEFGLPNGTFLEHPRVSPDEQWITFYTQSSTTTQGIYVYNRATRKTFYMGNFADKHPTWSGDGKKIFFHEQGKLTGTEEEIARVGYYNVNIVNGEASLGSRVILGDSNRELGSLYIYEKHPAYHTGLNLVFFHARDTIDGSKTLGVISLDHPDHKPLLLKLSYNGKKVKGAKHPDVSFRADSSLYYVGKVDGEDKDRLIKLDFQALKEIQKKFE